MSDSEIIPLVEEQDWSMIIEPQRSLLDLRLGELWRYRDLVWLFVWRDFVAYYKQTILGPLWYLIQPILTTVVFTVIFGNIAQLSTDGLPPFLFYLAGNLGIRLLAFPRLFTARGAGPKTAAAATVISLTLPLLYSMGGV